jgi:transglutaminase-like putative cysteine protease
MLSFLFALCTAIAASVPASMPAGHPIDVQLVVAHGLYQVTTDVSVPESWVQFSIPVPYRGQTPVAEVVTSDPPDKIKALTIVGEGSNRLLRVYLQPLVAGQPVLVRANTFVLVRREKALTGEATALPSGNDVPADVRKHLEPAAGVDASDDRIEKIAKGFARRDLKSLVDELFEFMTRNVKAGDGPQGAADVLVRGSATSAGNANLAAALLIAAKVPARILPCIVIGVSQEEYYIVEAWTPKLGWSKLEPTTKTFPLDDSKELILRFVDPTTPRSAGSLPLYKPIAAGVKVDFGAVPPSHDWQSAEVIENQQVPEGELDAIEVAARKAFEALVKPVTGARFLLVPKTKPPAALRVRGKKLLELIEHRLDG